MGGINNTKLGYQKTIGELNTEEGPMFKIISVINKTFLHGPGVLAAMFIMIVRRVAGCEITLEWFQFYFSSGRQPLRISMSGMFDGILSRF